MRYNVNVMRDVVNIFFFSLTKQCVRVDWMKSWLVGPVCLGDAMLLYVTALVTDGNIAQAGLVFYESAK